MSNPSGIIEELSSTERMGVSTLQGLPSDRVGISYPDTAESGETYDVEAFARNGDSDVPWRFRLPPEQAWGRARAAIVIYVYM